MSFMENLAMMGGSAGGDQAGGSVMFLVMMVALIGIMYFIVYRPQIKQRKALEASIRAMAKGDRVLTTGGIYGKVSSIKESIVVVEIAKDVKVEINKAMISRVLEKE
jgi:preprotein translocase subunit YajC